MLQYDTILFDFDGTIMNTMEGITCGVAAAFLKMGVAPPAREELTCFIGPPVIDAFQRFYGFSAEDARTATGHYREYYREHGLIQSEPYPGIPELLPRLKAAGLTIALATSKPQPFAETILHNTGLFEYFDILSGAGMDGSHNSKEDVIRIALSRRPGYEPARCLMVGDRDYDVIGAHAVGIRCAGILHGFGSREEFEACGADFIVTDSDALSALVLGVPAASPLA